MKTEKLLAAGVLATPLFFAVALTQAITREGFDLSKHMISQLSLDDLGWIQIANFIVTGTLFLLAALGIRRTMTTGIGHVWVPRLVAVFGAGLIAAGVFVADPANGYPVNAPETVAWHGILHGVAAMVAGLALVATNIILARRYHREGRNTMAATSIAIAIIFMVLPMTVPSLMSVLFASASFLAWGWISLLAASLLPRRTPAPVIREPQFA